MGVVIRRWVWLESIGVVSGCFLHITYIFLLHLYLFFFAAASLLLFSFCYNNILPETILSLIVLLFWPYSSSTRLRRRRQRT